MKIALLQLNPTVGDIDGNARLITSAARRAGVAGADLAVASELSLLGYPPRDLLLDGHLVARSWEVLEEMAASLRDGPPVLVGLAEPNLADVGRPLFNAAALLRDGRVAEVFHKTLLPTYDVFDEDRYFEPGQGPQILELVGLTLGISICEDVWNDRDFWNRRRYHIDPVEEMAASGAKAVLNLSASPFSVGKQLHREAMLGSMAKKYALPFLYVNQVGGNDDLVFDGRSMAFDCDGRLAVRGEAFAEDLVIVDLDPSSGSVSGSIAPDDITEEAEIWRALVLGTRDYLHKSGFRRALLGLSGGIDSSLVAAVVAEALGKENLLGVLMPSPYSSKESQEDAAMLASNLGIETIALPITDIMKAFEENLDRAFLGLPADVTEENIQARIRGNLLMALSNKYGSMLLTTGNKSEISVGYCTIYGDMAGGLAVISDVPKTMVYRLARWLNSLRGEVIPKAILAKAPSAELRPGQRDEDFLPPYHILDEILDRHIQGHQSAKEIVQAGFDSEIVGRVLRMVQASEFKRKQAAPGIKVTDRAFGSGWRMPIARKDACL